MKFTSLQITHNNDSSEAICHIHNNKHQNAVKNNQTDSYSALKAYW